MSTSKQLLTWDSQTLNTEAPSSFETLVTTYQLTWHDISGDLNLKHFLDIKLEKYSEGDHTGQELYIHDGLHIT